MAFGDFEGEVDAAVHQAAEAPEGGEQGLERGHFLGADVARAAAHLVGVTELPGGPGPGRGIFVLPAERAGPHRSEAGEVGLGLRQLGLPPGELRIVHGREGCRPAAAKSSARAAVGKFFSGGGVLGLAI